MTRLVTCRRSSAPLLHKVLNLANEEPRLKQPIIEGSPSIWAEVVYSVREEMATSIEDVLARRIGLQLFSWDHAIVAAPSVGLILAGEFSWSPGQRKEAVKEYANKIARLMQLVGRQPHHVPTDALD